MKNYLLLFCLILFSFNSFGQRSTEIILSKDFAQLDRKYNGDSLSLYQDNKLIATFDQVSTFALWDLEERIAGEGYCILYKNKILHFIIQSWGDLRLGIYNYNKDSNTCELIKNNNHYSILGTRFYRDTINNYSFWPGDYKKVIDNSNYTFNGSLESIEFLNSSILFLVDAGDYFLLRTIPDIESEQLEILNFDMKIMKE